MKMKKRKNSPEDYDDNNDHNDNDSICLELSLSINPKKIKHSPPPSSSSSSSSPLIVPSKEFMPIHSTTTLPLPPHLPICPLPPICQTQNYLDNIQFLPNHLVKFMSRESSPPPPPPVSTNPNHLPSSIPSRPGRRSNHCNTLSSPNNPTRITGDNNATAGARTIPPPYPWATNRPAVSHSLSYLIQRQITNITGTARCTKCEKNFEVSYDLRDKAKQVWDFIVTHNDDMYDRAPDVWKNPRLLTCMYCRRETARPVISEDKDTINWLFLFLGQLLGFCTIEQLKYFCGCTKNHRTGAKDRILYLTYHGILKQLGLDENMIIW